MAIVSLAELKEHLAFTEDLGTVDDALLTRLISAAESHVDRLLGFTMEATMTDGVPEDLRLAVTQLAAHWYENREAAGASMQEAPFGVSEIVREHRGWSF